MGLCRDAVHGRLCILKCPCAAMKVVEFRAATLRIGNKTILNGLTLGVDAGETLVLLGRSGSGKTTALRLINGMILPSWGEVRVDGKTTVDWDRVRLRRGIG